MTFHLKVEGFEDGGVMPLNFTCDGSNVSPALEWSHGPAETRSFALIVEDPDAPAGTWNHWLLWDISAKACSLKGGYQISPPVKSGTNDFGNLGYGGPCPPRFHGTHRYYFRLYALDVESLHLADGEDRSTVDHAMRGHIVATAEYMGRYSR